MGERLKGKDDMAETLRQRWAARLPRIRKRPTRAERAASDRADVISFATAQIEVAHQVLDMTGRWVKRLTQNADPLTASEPLLPELFETLLVERRLVAAMHEFHFRGALVASEPAWVRAKDAELTLNYALSDFHNALGRNEASDVLARATIVQDAANAVAASAHLLPAALRKSNTQESPANASAK